MKKEYSTNRFMFTIIVIFHYAIFAAFVAQVFIGWLYTNWFTYLTLCALIVRIITSRDECPLTRMENVYRKKLGISVSTGFMKDWILRPFKSLRGG